MKTHSLLLSASVIATLAWAGAAAAQATSPPPAPRPGAELEEIIVTAERRSESLQTTAIAASVLTGQDLANRGIGLVDQLQFIAPSVVINNFGQGIDFNIRGIGKGEHNTQTTTGVITYRDYIPSFPGYFTEEPYYDIARVEILRGPQGTFAGQNATGGAVFVTSNDPIINGGNTGFIQGQLGNYTDIGLQGAVNLPINDTLAARVAFNAETRDSFYDIKGPWTGDDGSLESGSIRVGLLWKPSDALTVLFKADYNYIDMGAYPADAVLAGPAPRPPAKPVLTTSDLFNISANAEQKALDKFGRAVLKIDYQFDGGTTLRSVTGYQDGTTTYKADLDGTSDGIWTFRDVADETLFSQELNLISRDEGPFTWVVGAFYQTNDYKFPAGEFIIHAPPPPAFCTTLNCDYVLWGTNDTWNAAGFAQVAYELSNGVSFSLGARYTDAHTTNHVQVDQYYTPPPCPPVGYPATVCGAHIDDDQSESFSGWSGKAAVDWTINADQFLYAFVATGFKPGGLNVPVGFGLPDPFTEETVTSYELGWKSRWFDGHLNMQLNGYYNDYNDFQVIVGYPTYPTFGFELNVPETTTIYGFEAQFQAAFGALSLDAGIGTTNSKLGKFYATDTRVPTELLVPGFPQYGGKYRAGCDPKTGPELPAGFTPALAPYVDWTTCQNLKGNEQTYAPQFTFNLGGQYDFTLSGGDMLTPRISFSHISSQWATLFENAAYGDRLDSRNIWNAQLAWQHGKVVSTLYGTNVSDEHYVGALNSGLRFAGPPMQFGIRVMMSF
jgi:iron complex outermembrane recepter protein